jgi:NAD(P)-dependent dehydrogenase (short-subunit alcohol dehydrogenase family)
LLKRNILSSFVLKKHKIIETRYNNELANKIALVTGGTKGAGKAIADRLKNAGATVIITARNEPEISDSSFHFIAADLSKSEGTEKVINEIKEKFGGLDILINNLGGSQTPGGGFKVLTDENWEHTIHMNLLAPVRLDRGLLPFRVDFRFTNRHFLMQQQRQH